MRLSLRRRDADWGLEGAEARRLRWHRTAVALIVIALAATVLAMTLARIVQIDAHDVITGSNQPVLVASLGADAWACSLIVLARRRRSLTIEVLARGTVA
jgi:uncharacterized membrane protein YidH (DUF202 family)